MDGEKFPSHIGTGTEDYYGYAWCRPEVFTDHPFIAQPSGSGNFVPGYSTNTRLRALDGIPFTKSIIFDMELWHWIKTRVNYAPVSFWYMIPGSEKLTAEDIAGAKEPVAMKRSDIYTPKPIISLEGENLLITNRSNVKIEYQSQIKDVAWSDETQLYWRDIEKGNKANFEFDSDFAGQFDFSCIFTIAPDYGLFNIFLNDKLIISNLDLYNYKVAVKEVRLGKVSLNQGKNTFSVELTGYPVNLQKSCFGIDKLIFRK